MKKKKKRENDVHVDDKLIMPSLSRFVATAPMLLLLTMMMMTTIPMAGSMQHYWLPLLLMVYLRRNQLCHKVSSSGPKVPGWSSFPPSFWVFCPVKKSWELVWYIYSSIFRSYYIKSKLPSLPLGMTKKKKNKKKVYGNVFLFRFGNETIHFDFSTTKKKVSYNDRGERKRRISAFYPWRNRK